MDDQKQVTLADVDEFIRTEAVEELKLQPSQMHTHEVSALDGSGFPELVRDIGEKMRDYEIKREATTVSSTDRRQSTTIKLKPQVEQDENQTQCKC